MFDVNLEPSRGFLVRSAAVPDVAELSHSAGVVQQLVSVCHRLK